MPLNVTKSETAWRCTECWQLQPEGSEANWIPYTEGPLDEVRAIINGPGNYQAVYTCSAWCSRCVVTRGIAGM